jgi:hypothetical protein
MHIWLGERRGYLSDWTTQLWVRATGRRLNVRDSEWLLGPIGGTRQIGESYFAELAASEGLACVPAAGLLPGFRQLGLGDAVAPAVSDFYERTSDYDVDAWSEWSGIFRPFGAMLAVLFSRRLQQLNVPLSALDTARGMTSELLSLQTTGGEVVLTAWIRKLQATRHVIYAGSYSTCLPPGSDEMHVKVVFPLPNGNAVVIMKPDVQQDGSLLLSSAGPRFGRAGFYFTVRLGQEALVARYIKSLRETIHVYSSDRADEVRADHVLTLWGRTFLRIHYRLRKRSPN